MIQQRQAICKLFDLFGEFIWCQSTKWSINT